ncbi:hypothetical protein MKEN_01406500 [Mycena kentingensis (nom. inval.)]|nr:hypothetical protein MKEN_01406500 [Mycena kentingensis (nom. inval.)]
MAVNNADHIVRQKFSSLLVPGYKHFPFADLPVELALRILSLAVGISQGTYRSLILTNQLISGYVRHHMLPLVPVMLTSKKQVYAFDAYLRTSPEVIAQIHHLWTIAPGSVYASRDVCVSVIKRCTSLRSLACHPHVLEEAFRYAPTLEHKHCTSLTLFQFRVLWAPSLANRHTAFAQLLHQVQRLHFIGCLDEPAWSNADARLPKLDNVRRVSVATGSCSSLLGATYENLLQSPKLEQLVITTRLHGEPQQNLKLAAPAIDHRIGIMHRRRRWKEHNLWRDGLQDAEAFWTQAAEEKDLPPAPRRP